MTLRRVGLALALGVAVLVAGCGGGGGNDTAPTAPAGSVASVAPPAGQDWSQVVARTPEDGYRMGNPAAPLKLVEYGSRLCPGCQQFYLQGVEKLVETYVKSGKVSFEFRDFPVHGPVDMPSILLGHCVATEAFFPVLDQMFADQPKFLERQTKLSQERYTQLQSDPAELASWLGTELGYLDFVQERGVPADKAKQCLADRAAIDKIAANAAKAGEAGVSGTPTFFLNGSKLPAGDWAGVEAALKQAGA